MFDLRSCVFFFFGELLARNSVWEGAKGDGISMKQGKKTQKIVAKYVYDRFREKEIEALNRTLLNNRCINSTNVHLCNYCTKIFVIVVNTCVCRRSVDNKALILSYPGKQWRI